VSRENHTFAYTTQHISQNDDHKATVWKLRSHFSRHWRTGIILIRYECIPFERPSKTMKPRAVGSLFLCNVIVYVWHYEALRVSNHGWLATCVCMQSKTHSLPHNIRLQRVHKPATITHFKKADVFYLVFVIFFRGTGEFSLLDTTFRIIYHKQEARFTPVRLTVFDASLSFLQTVLIKFD
jgi:hypothetical protein